MKIIREVTWSGTVFPAWQRSANDAPRPNSDVWRPLPAAVRWYEAEVEPGDVEQLYLIGSGDLRETFGSYKLAEIV